MLKQNQPTKQTNKQTNRHKQTSICRFSKGDGNQISLNFIWRALFPAPRSIDGIYNTVLYYYYTFHKI